ncbi:MAG: hypothetical protein DRN68_06420 [Thaumarchaeota archaeon]|nr:MAG: hypothetical protein DRN68_06420 [Nitrososphaerota archaeon]
MTKQKVVKVSLSVLTMVIVVATATTLKLEILDRPGGRPIGTWEGPVEVLAVEGRWAKVRMLGWVPKAQIAPAAPEGVRLEGSPGGGIWVSSVRIQKDFLGDAQVTGWVTNATGKDFEMLMLEAVLVDSSGDVIDAVPVLISHIPEGASKGFAAETAVPFGQVAEVIFQFSAAL